MKVTLNQDGTVLIDGEDWNTEEVIEILKHAFRTRGVDASFYIGNILEDEI